jgi:glycosyltransferase involved in cell wall biosynthesis
MQPTEKNDSLASKSRILWVTPKWPFPIADGARMATTQLLKNLTSRGMDIHLVSIVPTDETVRFADAERELGIQEVTLIRRNSPNRLQQILNFIKAPFIPITLFPYCSASVVNPLKQLLNDERFDLVVYDGLHTAAWKMSLFSGKKPRCAEAYRAHNVESDLWFRAIHETSNPFKKALLYFQGHLVKRFEKRLAREADYLFPVSMADASIFQTYVPRGKLHTLPIGIQVQNLGSKISPDGKGTNRKILFIGKLDWAPNKDGLKWVLDKVWPKVMERAPDLTLTIVGSGNRAWLDHYRDLKGVNIVGQVESVAPYYDDCIATIVPVFYGSGTRVKAIESSLYGRVCISTLIGVEGMGLVDGENYHRAELEEEWVHTLSFLESSLAIQMGVRAREYAKHAFDPGAIAERFMNSISRSIAT